MTKDEALKLALEALEDRSSLMKWQEARDAVKEALAQPEQEFGDLTAAYMTGLYDGKKQRTQPEQEWRNAAIRVGENLSSVGPNGYYDMTAQQWLDWAMEQQPRGENSLAQPEQEPVAWMFQHDETGRMNYVSNDGIHNPTMFLEMNPRYALVCALYTTPPQRKPLTDEQKVALCKQFPDHLTFNAIHAIEAAHGIKGEA